MKALSIKPFVPAKDFALSKEFYMQIGFNLDWENEEICQFSLGDFQFLLQNFYIKEFGENYMLQLIVDNVANAYEKIEPICTQKKFNPAKISEPAMQPWGMNISFLHDPSNVLWHIGEIH